MEIINDIKNLYEAFQKLCDYIEETDEIGCEKCPISKTHCFEKVNKTFPESIKHIKSIIENDGENKGKGVVLYTNEGIFFMGRTQCSNGNWFDADGCFKYCNDTEMGKEVNKHQMFKLKASSTLISYISSNDENWYTKRENFKDVVIDFDCDQKYIEYSLRGTN